MRFTVFGTWIRLYIGRSFFQRPRIYRWSGHGHSGIVLRRSRGVGGRNGQRTIGLQWSRNV